ncbi:MAG: F0F1 ATP synthase subunit delta [Sphingomonadales bacterium]|nr:F0F1 ATP synthase subunit delta [Sphingomonadales bacterium]
MGNQKAVVSGVAGRYAVALFELAADGNALDQVAADLKALADLVEKSADFRRLVTSPALGRDDQAKGLFAVLEGSGIAPLTRNFLGVIANNGRLSLLADMIAAYATLLAHHRGEVTAEVTSATPLSEGQMAALKAKLKAIAGRDVTLQAHTDSSILGGLVVKLGSRMIDSTLKTKLNNLQTAMKEAQ